VAVVTGWKVANYEGNQPAVTTVAGVVVLKDIALHVGITAEGKMMVELMRSLEPTSMLDCYCLSIPAAKAQVGVPFSVEIPWRKIPADTGAGELTKKWYANIYWREAPNPALVLNGVTASPKYSVTTSVPQTGGFLAAHMYASYMDRFPAGTITPAIGTFETATALLADQDFISGVDKVATEVVNSTLQNYEGRYVSC
jgi:hypothetical protein